MDLVPDLVCVASADGRFIQVSKSCEKILGYTADELQGTEFLTYIHPDDLQSTIDVMQEMNQKNILNFENRYICKDGKVVTLCWNASQWASGGLTYAIARPVGEPDER